MRLVSFARSTGLNKTAQRIDAEFQLNTGEAISMYFEIDGANKISDSAVHDCLYLLGTSIAFWVGEDYAQCQAVDAQLLRNVRSAHREWSKWTGSKGAISQDVEHRASAAKVYNMRPAAVFFSGGVDSFFTLLNLPRNNLTALSLEHSDSDPNRIADAFDRLSELRAASIDGGGTGTIGIVTNMMTAHPRILDQWALRLHGCFYAACAHLVSDTISTAAISSTFEYGNLKAWGSHPLIDPLWSSSHLQLEHFGATHTRAEKTESIATSNIALTHLSVCEHGRYQLSASLNCSMCTKCYRTMLTFDALGYSTQEVTAFDWTKYSLINARKVFVHGPGEARLLNEVVKLTARNNRNDIRSALTHAIGRSRPLWWITSLERWVRRKVPGVLKYRSQLRSLRSGITGLLGYRSP